MKQLAQKVFSLCILMPLVAGCGGGSGSKQQSDGDGGLQGQDFEDASRVSNDGNSTEDDENDDCSIKGDADTADEDTTFTCSYVAPENVEGDAAPLAEEAGAILRVSADHEVPGSVQVLLRLGTRAGPGIGGRLWGVVLAREDGTAVWARGQELTMEEETGETWLEFTVPGEDLDTPTDPGARMLVVDLQVDLTGAVDDGDVAAGGEVQLTLAWSPDQELRVTGDVLACGGGDGWDEGGGGDPCEVFEYESTSPVDFDFVCDGATDRGPEVDIIVSGLTLTHGDLDVSGGDPYLVHVRTVATCAGAQVVTLSDLPGLDQGDRVAVGTFGDIDASGGFLTTFGYDEGAVFVDAEGGAVVLDVDHLADDRIGVVAASTGSVSGGSQIQGAQADALISYGNDGYGITAYDPVAGIFGATQIDPQSGSVSDVDTFEEDASRGVVVQSGRNRVAFFEHVTTQFGNYFSVQGSTIPATLFPAATGFVISAARRNQATPVYFVTVGATPNDPGTLWRKDNPADFVTPATALGQVGNAPRRIRFLKSIGIVSNSFSDTLTILVRDASDNVTIKGTVNVGDGPIGIDLLELPNGNIGVASAGFLGNTYTVTILEPDGDVVSNVTAPVPNGGDKPSCAVWADAEGKKVAVSCSGSGELILVPLG